MVLYTFFIFIDLETQLKAAKEGGTRLIMIATGKC